jgi:hypothetical protein
MAYRKPRNRWSALVSQFRSDFAPAGVPHWVFEDKRRWNHFVQSGYTCDLAGQRFFSVLELTVHQVVCLGALMLGLGCTHEEAARIMKAHPGTRLSGEDA